MLFTRQSPEYPSRAKQPRRGVPSPRRHAEEKAKPSPEYPSRAKQPRRGVPSPRRHAEEKAKPRPEYPSRAKQPRRGDPSPRRPTEEKAKQSPEYPSRAKQPRRGTPHTRILAEEKATRVLSIFLELSSQEEVPHHQNTCWREGYQSPEYLPRAKQPRKGVPPPRRPAEERGCLKEDLCADGGANIWA